MTKLELEKGYEPSENEEYMCQKQLEYFKRKLLAWKEDLLDEAQDTIDNLKNEKLNEPDINDRATIESDTAFELKTRDRCRKVISKIEIALEKIKNSEYGYCEETDEPIGIRRLQARPIAALCIEAQERHEKHEREHNEE